MSKAQKIKYICFICLLLVASMVVPFLTKDKTETVNSVLSLVLTALSTVSSLVTLIIAFILYDRFGLEGKFIENQTNQVLKLVDLLKGKVILVQRSEFTYPIRPSTEQLKHLETIYFYSIDKKKELLFSYDDYDIWTREILALGRSYWMPQKIKDRMQFLEIALFCKIDEFDESKYIKVNFKSGLNNEWSTTIPTLTFEELNTNIYLLSNEIKIWLNEHSSVHIDLKLEEPQ